MGRSGKLDFSVDRVRGVHGEWLPVRYTLTKKEGDSKAVSTGIITAGVAVVFWPAAPFVLLRHGKDTTINKGVTFDVFIDGNHTINTPGSTPPVISTAPPQYQPVRPAAPGASMVPVAASSNAFAATPAPAQPVPGDAATVAISSSDSGADIEINGNFVGSTPTAIKLAPGQYTVAVRRGTQVWQRVLQVTAGSTITLNAVFEQNSGPLVRHSRN